MKKKTGNFLEEYADKIVFGVVGVISLVLIWFFLISNSYVIKIGSRTLGPGEADKTIKKMAETLEVEINKPAEPKPYQANRTDQFEEKLICTIKEVPDFVIALPGNGEGGLPGDRKYRLPDIGVVRDIAVAVFRGTGRVPVSPDEVGPGTPYKSAETVLEDMDLITVQGRIDAQNIFANFSQHFAGSKVAKREWSDQGFARPVFAAVRLERSRLGDNGVWSEWEEVPRPRIDPYKTLLAINETTEGTSYDARLLMRQFDTFGVKQDVLQPEPYDFAHINTRWLAPAYHEKYQQKIKEQREQKRREEFGKDRDTRDTGRTNRPGGRQDTGNQGADDRTGRRTTRPTRGTQNETARRPGGARGQDAMRGVGVDMLGLPVAQKEEGPEKILADFEKEKITDKASLDRKNSLLVWAHDDTITIPGTYRYRLKVGVFNPIAGRNWFYSDQEHLKDKTVLWTEYSEPTKPVQVYSMNYFFPLAVSGDGQDAVKIRISKYHMGRWHDEEFNVRPGEIIGRELEGKETDAAATAMYGMGAMLMDEQSKMIDYTTKAVLVDVINGGSLSGSGSVQKDSEEILYSDDTVMIKHLPVKERNWPVELKEAAKMIREAQSEETETSPTGMEPGRRMRPDMMMPGTGGMPPGQMTPEMMMRMMMMQQQRQQNQ